MPAVNRRLFGLWQTRHAALAFVLFAAAGGLLAAASSRHALLAFLATGLSVTGSLALLEAAGALGLVSWPELLAPRPSVMLGSQRVPHLNTAGTSFQDTAWLWGLPSDPIPFRYRTDRHGFRNDVDRAIADIYLVGDSVLVASLVPFPKTVTARLEEAIRRPVMQVALIKLSPQEERQIFRDARLEVSGRLVLLFVSEDSDLRDSKRFRDSMTFRESASAGRHAPLAMNSLTHQLVLVLQKLTQPVSGEAALRSCAIGDQTYLFRWTRESFAGFEDEATVISDTLLQFAAEVREAGGEFAIVFVPSKLRVLGPFCRFPAYSELTDLASHLGPLREHLRTWSERSGITLLDLTEPLQRAARLGRVPWFWGDVHWNAEGHAVAAEALAAWELVRKARSN
jgi:hypothetical protein